MSVIIENDEIIISQSSSFSRLDLHFFKTIRQCHWREFEKLSVAVESLLGSVFQHAAPSSRVVISIICSNGHALSTHTPRFFFFLIERERERILGKFFSSID